MKKRHHLTAWVLGLAVGLVALGSLTHPVAAPAREQQKGFAAFAKHALADEGVNGIVLYGRAGGTPTIVINDHHAVGRQRVTADRYVPIASLQKLLTGLAIHVLVDEGKLSLTTPLADFFPGVAHAREITVQRLLTHTSGLVDTSTRSARILTTPAAQYDYANHHFKSTGAHVWNYTNIDYVLLAQMIVKRSGQSYQDFVTKHVLDPAGARALKPFTAVPRDQVVARAALDPLASWTSLRQEMSVTPGAGDYLGTPRAYWRLISSLVNDPATLNWFRNHATGTVPYFGGLYMGKGQLHANGGFPSYSMIVYSDYRTKKTLIFASNNTSLLKAKQVRDRLIHRYFIPSQK